MKYILVKPDGTFGDTQPDFTEAPPKLAPNKGQWMPVQFSAAPQYDVLTHTVRSAFVVSGAEVVQVWDVLALPPEQSAELAANAARAELYALDLASIRAIREYIASKPDAPAVLVQREQDAKRERGRIK